MTNDDEPMIREPMFRARAMNMEAKHARKWGKLTDSLTPTLLFPPSLRIMSNSSNVLNKRHTCKFENDNHDYERGDGCDD